MGVSSVCKSVGWRVGVLCVSVGGGGLLCLSVCLSVPLIACVSVGQCVVGFAALGVQRDMESAIWLVSLNVPLPSKFFFSNKIFPIPDQRPCFSTTMNTVYTTDLFALYKCWRPTCVTMSLNIGVK